MSYHFWRTIDVGVFEGVQTQLMCVCKPVPWLLMRMFMGSWDIASRLCCRALCRSLWWSSAGSAIFFSGGSPASSLSRSCSRAATWAAIAACAAWTAATECPAGRRAIPTLGSGWPPSSERDNGTALVTLFLPIISLNLYQNSHDFIGYENVIIILVFQT